MKNINKNQLCSVELTIKGNDPLTGDVLQLAIIPLTVQMEVDKSKRIFFAAIKPVNTKLSPLLKDELLVSKENVALFFDTWFQSLNLKDGKKILPVTYDWAIKRSFLNTIFWESLDDYFSTTVRDITPSAVLVDDTYYYCTNQYIYQKCFFRYIANKSGHPCHMGEDVLSRAIKIPKIYKSIMLELAKLI